MLTYIASVLSAGRRIAAEESWKRDEEKGRTYLASLRPFDSDDFAQECAAIRLENPGLADKQVWSGARKNLRHPQPVSIELIFGLQAKPLSDCETA